MRAILEAMARSVSLGVGVILTLALASVMALALWPIPDRPGLEMWIFSPEHQLLYEPALEQRAADNRAHVNMRVIGIPSLKSRMMSAFFAGIPTADLIEIERQMAGQAFTGPIEAVGFADLTELIAQEGLLEQINEPSFGPWTSRGRIFGLPHDVHPVLLGYRADIVEAAGIDVTQIETWDDFKRVLAPLMSDDNDDGDPDRYLLGMWFTDADRLETVMLQGGGRLFDEQGRVTMNTELNARLLAEMITWFVGPDRIAADVPDFSAAGNQLKIEGYAIAYLMPDWMCNIWRLQMPQLEGKVKVMPMPAWEPGGRRTSVWGGTMLGIAKTTERFDESWELAKDLYFSDAIARELYTRNDIVTPIKLYWDDPMFDEPDAYFSGQAKGRMYVDQAPLIPARTSSPYYKLAIDRLRDAAVAIAEWSRSTGTFDRNAIEARCKQELERAESLVRLQMQRNVFLEATP